MRRFVIFCQARAGTHLLRTSLEQHPAVRCAWEPFNDKAVARFPYNLDTPARDILELLWRNEPGILAAGFPVHLTHGRCGRAWGELWTLLADDSSLTRLHLYRRNLLHQLISHTLALRTGHWMQPVESPTEPPTGVDTLTLNPDYCRDWFAATAHAVRAQQRSMPDALTLSYEDLAENLIGALAPVFQRLGVDPVTVRPKIRKQGKPTETLENFDQLRDACTGTPWQSFFDNTHHHTWDSNIQHPPPSKPHCSAPAATTFAPSTPSTTPSPTTPGSPHPQPRDTTAHP